MTVAYDLESWLMIMEDPRPPLFATIAIILGPLLFLRSFRDLRTQRLVRNTRSAHIHSMAMGFGEISGEIVPRSTLPAPFSGRPCAYWEVEISTPSRRTLLTVLHRNASGHPFFLRDETGTVMVMPHGAATRINAAIDTECPAPPLPEPYARYMSGENLDFRDLWPLRFRERILEEGQRVFVFGTAIPREHAYTIAEGVELAATGTEDAATRRLHQLTDEAVAVMRVGAGEPTLIISEQSECDLARALGRSFFGGLAAGPALTLLGLAYWLYAFYFAFAVR